MKHGCSLPNRIKAFEMKCLRQILNISYREHKTNEYVRQQIEVMAGKLEPLLATVKRRKMQWFGHTTRHNSLPKTVLQGTVGGGRKQGWPHKSWIHVQHQRMDLLQCSNPPEGSPGQNHVRAGQHAASMLAPQWSPRPRHDDDDDDDKSGQRDRRNTVKLSNHQ